MDNNRKANSLSFRESSEIDFQEIYFTLLNNKKIIISTTSMLIGLGILFIFCSIPLYKSSGTIIVSDPSKSIFAGTMNFNAVGGSNLVENEIEVLKSNETLRRTIDYFINNKPIMEPFDDLDNNLIRSNNEPFIDLNGNGLWESGEYFYYESMFLFKTKKYEPQGLSKFLRKILFVDYLFSDDVVDVANQSQKNDLIDSLEESISVYKRRGTDVIDISISTPDAFESKQILNVLMETYQNLDKDVVNDEMIQMKSFLDSEIEIKEEHLEKVRKDLSSFQEQEQIFDPVEQYKILSEMRKELIIQRNSNQVEWESNRKTLSEQKANLTKEQEELVEKQKQINDIEALKELNRRQQIVIAEKDHIEAKHGKENEAALAKVKEINQNQVKIDAKTISLKNITVTPDDHLQKLILDIMLRELKDSEYSFRIAELNELIKQIDLDMFEMPNKALQIDRLKLNIENLSKTYSLMVEKRTEAKIGEASKSGKIRILERARIEDDPIKPKKSSILILSFISGILFGSAISLTREWLDNSVKSISEIERYDLDILAMVPTIGNGNTKNSETFNKQNFERRLITHEDSKSPVSEAYRTLRTNLIYRSNPDVGQAILVSSPGPGEGKTTTIANLAITFANLGKKTLLVDTDLRKPVMHTVFNKEQSPGLTNYLMGTETDLNKLINNMDIDNLGLMTSGNVPPFPSELLGSDRMQVLIQELKNNWDVVLFDLPPLMAVTDAYVILKEMDQFLLVLRAGVTQKGALKRSMSYLNLSGIGTTGVVINQGDKAKASKDERFDYYQDYYGDID